MGVKYPKSGIAVIRTKTYLGITIDKLNTCKTCKKKFNYA